jgi:DNA-binding winged helix-turn-helix (wHTH) protein/tetratricopeptide (TPR) repeat protein
MNGERFAFGPFVIELDRRVLVRDGVPVAAGARAMAILVALLRAGGQVVRKDELIEAAWPRMAIEESNLSVQIASLRGLLGRQSDGSDWIVTVPRVGYRFAGPLSSGSSRPLAARTLVAVAPFTDTGGGGEAPASGVGDDIVVALSRFGWFAVTGEDSADAHYRVQGSVRRSGDRFRVAVQLIETRTGVRVFAANYDSGSADLFTAQDEVAQRVAAAVEASLLRADGRDAQGTTPFDLVKRGSGLFHRLTPPTHREARELFRAAADLAPDHAEAWAWLARVSAGLIAYGWSGDPAADAAEGIAAGLAGVRADPASPYAHYGLAIVSLYGGATDQAYRAAERAVELNSSFALGHLVHGLALLARGDPDPAMTSLRRGIDLSPNDPQGFAWLNILALAQLFSGSSDAALATASQVLKLRPDWRVGFETMVCCQMSAGHRDEARRTYERLTALSTETAGALAPVFIGNPQWRERIDGLLAAASGVSPGSANRA